MRMLFVAFTLALCALRPAPAAAGRGDLFWYVPASSPVRMLRDIGDRTIAYSTNGSASHAIVLTFISERGLGARPVEH